MARLPLEGDCRLTLLTVLPEAGERDAEAILASARDVLRYTPAALSTEVRRGLAGDEILHAVEAHAADLVVVESRGLSDLRRFLIGSIAEQVARFARCPVLLARPLVSDLRTAVLGTDGSHAAGHAAEWLRHFPLPEECALRIVTVMPQLDLILPFAAGPWPAGVHGIYREVDQKAQQRLNALVTSFTLAGRSCSAHLRSGDPADGLLQDAEEAKADLLVVGSRGLSAVQRFLLGSVSEKVMRYAACSVLVVK